MGDDFSSAFIQGGSQIQNVIGQQNKEKLDIAKMLSEQAFQQAQQGRAETFQGEQGDLNRSNSTENTQISSGPAYMAQNRENQIRADQIAAGKESATADSSDAASLTTPGKTRDAFLSRGLLSGPQAIATLPDKSKEEYMANLISSAHSQGDGADAEAHRRILQQAMADYGEVSKVEAWRDSIKKQETESDKVMPYKYDPTPVIPAVKSLIESTFKDSGYFGDKPMLQYMKEASGGWQGTVNGMPAQSIREQLNVQLADKIMETNPDFSGNYLRAYQAASAIWKNIEIGGIGNLYSDSNVDENGNPTNKSERKIRPIDMHLEKASFFSGGRDAGPTESAPAPAPKSGSTSQNMTDFYLTGKTPVADKLK